MEFIIEMEELGLQVYSTQLIPIFLHLQDIQRNEKKFNLNYHLESDRIPIKASTYKLDNQFIR